MRMGTVGLLAGAIASTFGAAAIAQNNPRLSQAMFVERISESGTARIVKRADALSKGDRVILLVKWKSAAPGTSFTVSSAVPKAMAFERSSIREQAVSVDGGKSWGRIGDLVVRDAYGERLASVEDVTHLRWQISEKLAAQGSGTITYSAIVR